MTELLFLQWKHLGRGEKLCLGVLLAALLAWAFMPPVAQNPAYHAFADQRAWLGIPRAADVLSNIAFLAIGALGVARLVSPRRARFARATEAGLWCVALGFVGTAIGSAWYHVDPNDATLVWDRLLMTLIFTGLLGASIAQRIGENVARVGLAVIFELGIASVLYWHVTGDLSLYLTLQFGGIVALVLLLLLTRRSDDPFVWWWVLAWYALAKLAEAGDEAVWNATGGLIAGHMLKHLFAAVAGAVVFAPLSFRYEVRRHAQHAPRTSGPS